MKRLLVALIASLSIAPAFGQAILQGGPWTPGHAPMYVGQGNSQPIVQDSGPASGGGIGLGLAEQLLQIRSATNTYPAANAGTGQFSTNFCDYDGPTTNATGYHFLCLSPNAQGGGLIAYGAAGGAATLPLSFSVNNTTYPFPFAVGGIVGPATSIVNDVACWNNLVGTLLKDCGAAISTSTNNTWTGTNNFTGTFQIGGVTQTFPASGNIIGNSDVQTLTNKSISASEVNSGTLSAVVFPALTGDVTNSAGSLATTISAGAVSNSKLATATQNTVKGAATSTSEADLAVPPCSSAGNALQWVTNTGYQCATLTSQSAGFGLQLSGSAFSISQSAPPYGFDAPVNLGLSAGAAGSNLTITMVGANGSVPSATNPVLIPFRNGTLTNGAPVWAAITATQTLVIPSGATLGTSNSNIAFRLWIFESYNGGSPQLGAAICSTATQIYPCASWEYNRVTSTTISALATSPGVLYTTAGVSNDPVRIIGYCEYASGLATAGSWASSCTTLQLFGPGIKKPGEDVQVVQATSASSVTTTSSSFGTGAAPANAATATITPTSAANIMSALFVGNINTAVPANSSAYCEMFRGASGSVNTAFGVLGGSNSVAASMVLSGLDAPNTTSAIQYTERARNTDNSTSISCPLGSGGSTNFITITEKMG